ncbi:MAG: hypothetical protein GDA45_07545 [Chromatiales bacterium]|nr:hypothetical protein [Chromatiales bacterium]
MEWQFSVTVDYSRIMSPENWRKALGKDEFDSVSEYEMLEYLENNMSIPGDLEEMIKFATKIDSPEDFENMNAKLETYYWGFQND